MNNYVGMGFEVSMKRIMVIACALILVAAYNSASGFSWTAGYYDHGASPFDFNNNTAPIDYPYGVGYLPSPGYFGEGGEGYDEEGFFVDFDDDYMYLALTNSFGMAATSETGVTVRQGDIFFGYGGVPNMYAIDVSTGDLRAVETWSYIQDIQESYYSHIPTRMRIGAFEVLTGNTLGTANQNLTFWEGLETTPLLPDKTGGNTYVFEWRIDRSLLGWNGESDIFFHTTLGCGNDLIEYTYPGVPEPTTIILLGLGMLGAGFITRRK
jgi:hypothetical protein